MENELIYWIWLRTHTPAASPVGAQLLRVFGDAEGVYRASETQLKRVESLSAQELARLCDKDIYFEERTLAYCTRYRIKLITWNSPDYPEPLRALGNPPILLFCFGNLPEFNERNSFSVVGTRRMSEYGKRMTYEISYGLAKAGITVVSGMALGIDAVASAAALAAGGTTVAVLGNGFGRIYPAEHAKLHSEIIRHGAVITEYVPGDEPAAEHFPQRNRIIAALGGGLAVMEAGKGSGALITARIASELGKTVFVLPENVTEPNSYGTAFLAKQGARLVTSAYDVLDAMELEAAAALVPRTVKPDADVVMKKYSVASKPYNSATRSSAAKPLSRKRAAENEESSENGHPPQQKAEAKSAFGESDVLRAMGEGAAALYRRIPEEGSILSDFLVADSPDPTEAASDLALLEINGYIETLPGGYYRRSKSE